MLVMNSVYLLRRNRLILTYILMQIVNARLKVKTPQQPTSHFKYPAIQSTQVGFVEFRTMRSRLDHCCVCDVEVARETWCFVVTLGDVMMVLVQVWCIIFFRDFLYRTYNFI